MSNSNFTDLMRVEVRDLDGHLIRVLDLSIEPEVVLQGGSWLPGVVVPDAERNMEADLIAMALNEDTFPRDADGLADGAGDTLLDGEDKPDVRWSAKRVPIGTSRPHFDLADETPAMKP